MHRDLGLILRERGAISVRDFPGLKSALARAKRAGEVDSVLPGVYVAAEALTSEILLRAAVAWSAPLGVIHDRTAAAIWLGTKIGPVPMIAHPTLGSCRRVSVSGRRIPPEFVSSQPGMRLATAAFACVEVAGVDDGRLICDALRLGLVDYASLTSALAALSGTRGNDRRRIAVAAAESNPWSYAELRLHRVLRTAGITDWVANQPLAVGRATVFPDVRLRRARLILEFDGRESHEGRAAFLSDRERENLLVAAGYRVLRFGWDHLDDPNYIVATVRSAMRSER